MSVVLRSLFFKAGLIVVTIHMRVFQAFGEQSLQTIPKLSVCVEEICASFAPRSVRNFTESLKDPNPVKSARATK